MKGRNQLLMGFTGSLENVTAIKAADGDTILKGKITDMTNPRSEKQTDQRYRFDKGVIWAKELLAFRNTYYKRKNPMRSPYNDMVGGVAGLQEMLQTDAREDDLEKLVVLEATNGPVFQPATYFDSNELNSGTQSVRINWDNPGGLAGGDANDEVYVLVWNPGEGDVQVIETGAIRSDLTAPFSVNNAPTEGFVFALFFVSPTTGENSTALFMWTLPTLI